MEVALYNIGNYTDLIFNRDNLEDFVGLIIKYNYKTLHFLVISF